VPVAGRRYIRASGSRITSPTDAVAPLPSGGRITAGMVLFDGTTLAAVTEHGGRHEVVLIAIASGPVQHTVVAAR
jgi:hypothetical protein